MSMYIEIVSSLPHEEIVRILEKDMRGPVRLEGMSDNANIGRIGNWNFGAVVMRPLNEETREELNRRFDLPSMQTRVRFYCDVRSQGEDAIYEMIATVLPDWTGDFALMPGGDDLSVRRVDGELTLFKEHLSEEHLELFPQPHKVVSLKSS